MKVQLSSAALEDLKSIRSYISDVLGNSAAADRIIRKIRQSYSLLSETPFIGVPLKNKTNVNTAHRFLICENYLIFYIVEKNVASISRIIYGKRDYAKFFYKSFIEDNEDIEK